MLSLPEKVKALCRAVNAPPRLVAHLTLVHDVAVVLVGQLKDIYPELQLDSEIIYFGAATHDIGKSLHQVELSEVGNAHEADGERLLLTLNVDQHLARFARTHASWQDNDSLVLEDLIVALADNCWKGKRPAKLETLIAEKIADHIKSEVWEVFIALDEILQRIAEGADERLAWQARFPV